MTNLEKIEKLLAREPKRNAELTVLFTLLREDLNRVRAALDDDDISRALQALTDAGA